MKLLAAALSLLTLSASAVDIVAHRGASFDAPENTVASARLAWEQAADAVEIDIWLTQDQRIVVHHDRSLKRTTGLDAHIPEQTLATIRELDAGQWKDAKFTGEKVPIFSEILATVPPGKRLFVEIKCGPEIVPPLKEALDQSALDRAQIVIISFNYESARAAKAALPEVPVFLLASYRLPPETNLPPGKIDEMILACQQAGLDGLDLQHTWPLDEAALGKINQASLQLHVWTVDDAEIAKRWIDHGVMSITTNRPAWLREALSSPPPPSP